MDPKHHYELNKKVLIHDMELKYKKFNGFFFINDNFHTKKLAI